MFESDIVSAVSSIRKTKLIEYPKGIQFRYSWRKYQQRVLDDLQDHLTDGHLHVIAPPGSGKTILGLEVARRLNKPTLILAPNLTIRNQWIQRFCELFLQTSTRPGWISTDIRKPKFMTLVTYQGLHAACNDLTIEEEEPEEENEINESSGNRSSNTNLDAIVEGLKADALLNSLIEAGVIKTIGSQLIVETHVNDDGSIYCHLAGGTTLEKSTFIEALQETIAPIDNPRYIIVRKNRLTSFIRRHDYHAVPELIGKNKNLAEYFMNQWQSLVGACDLIYTRTMDGRKVLLTARMKALSTQMSDKIEHVNKWR